MNKQFTASEVRGQIAWLRNVTAVGTKTTYQMLDAYADLLEAQERAEPVAYADAATREEILNVAMRKGGYGCEVPLFVHPASSDAERLAEALRKIVDIDYVKRCCNNGIEVHYPDAPPEMECCGDPDVDFGPFAQIAMDALAAHSAPAQPPAASVTDAVFPSHRACVPYENHPGKRIVGFVIDESHPWWGKCGLTEPLSALEAALASQENLNG